MDDNTKQTQSGKKPRTAKPRTKRAETAAIVQAEKAKSAQEIKNTIHEACKPKRGQPTKFTPELWERVLEAVATYQDLIEICSEPDMPAVSTIYRWMRQDKALLDDMRGAWEMFSMLGKSYNTNILREGKLSTGDFRRDEALVADNRWFMGKTNRRDFGDKTTVDLNSTVQITVPDWAAQVPSQEVLDGELIGPEGEMIDPDATYERETVARITREAVADEDSDGV